MRWFCIMAAALLAVGCSGSSGDSSLDATVDDGGDRGDSGGNDANGQPTCPTSGDGCNIVVGTIGGDSLVFTHACPSFGAFNQSVWLTNYAIDTSCVSAMAAEPSDRALELEWFDVDPPTFDMGYWYPTGPSGAVRTEATSGTAVMDVWDVPNSRMRGTFDLWFGSDHVCGCFDAVAP